MSIAAVIVTWNRLDLLRQAYQRVREQSRPPDTIIIVDNRSDDGTWETVRAWARTHPDTVGLRTVRNLGGSGGFALGFHRALASDARRIWVLDDDTLAEPDCLAELDRALDRYPPEQAPIFASSVVTWTDGLPHPMNWPNITHGDRQQQGDFVRCLAHGHVPLRAATYVSTLFEAAVVGAHGLPLLDYFIWSDDIEHTLRLHGSTGRPGILVASSRALHATATDHTCMDARPERFYYHVRNGLWNIRLNPGFRPRERRIWYIFHLLSVWRYLLARRFRPTALRCCLAGLWRGLFRRPRPNPPLEALIAERTDR